jgi:hypothetical protein
MGVTCMRRAVVAAQQDVSPGGSMCKDTMNACNACMQLPVTTTHQLHRGALHHLHQKSCCLRAVVLNLLDRDCQACLIQKAGDEI